MRLKVFQEGVLLPHGRMIQHGALRSNDRQIFVFLNGDHNNVIGFAEDLKRDDDGWVSYEITFRADFLERFKRSSNKITDWFDFSAWASECSKVSDEVDLITSGVIKAIHAFPISGYPRASNMSDSISEQRNENQQKRTTEYAIKTRRILEMRAAGYPVSEIAEATELFESNVLSILAENRKPEGAVTDNIDYVKIAKDELVKYINDRAEKTDGFQINTSYLYVVWFSKTLQNWKALISTSLPDGMYYELTFNGSKDQLYIDAYKKFDNVTVDLYNG